jgi:hypothetical protein
MSEMPVLDRLRDAAVRNSATVISSEDAVALLAVMRAAAGLIDAWEQTQDIDHPANRAVRAALAALERPA